MAKYIKTAFIRDLEMKLQNEINHQNNRNVCATEIKRYGATDRDGKTDRNGATDHDGKTDRNGATARVAPTTIPDIVGAYKSLVSNGCLEIFKTNNQTMGKFWQRNYYENIIRNEQSYQKISEYIINNPTNWQCDKFYLK